MKMRLKLQQNFQARSRVIFTRFTNPTVAMFEKRLAALEGAERAVATSSGMAAIMAVAMAYLKAGDHVICSRAVFGSTVSLFENTWLNLVS